MRLHEPKLACRAPAPASPLPAHSQCAGFAFGVQQAATHTPRAPRSLCDGRAPRAQRSRCSASGARVHVWLWCAAGAGLATQTLGRQVAARTDNSLAHAPLHASRPGNEFSAEALPGALPRGQNSPQVRVRRWRRPRQVAARAPERRHVLAVCAGVPLRPLRRAAERHALHRAARAQPPLLALPHQARRLSARTNTSGLLTHTHPHTPRGAGPR